jgi:predicted acyl esterase
MRLDPPLTRDVIVQRDLRTPMPDGVELLADRWAPAQGESLPTALLRSPYGRRGAIGSSMARPLAERGFQVLIQSTRGTFGSGGVFDPFRREREDGLATLEWVVKQLWFGDSIVLVGPSYLGYVQWAVADSLPPEVKARKNRRAMAALPLERADVTAIGQRDDYIQDILVHDSDAERWAGIDHKHRVAEVSVPVSSIGGWYEIFLPGQLRDFQILQAERRPIECGHGAKYSDENPTGQ